MKRLDERRHRGVADAHQSRAGGDAAAGQTVDERLHGLWAERDEGVDGAPDLGRGVDHGRQRSPFEERHERSRVAESGRAVAGRAFAGRFCPPELHGPMIAAQRRSYAFLDVLTTTTRVPPDAGGTTVAAAPRTAPSASPP